MAEWQPIETAPKDGEILVWCNAWFGEIHGYAELDFTTIAKGGDDDKSDAYRTGKRGPWWLDVGGDAYTAWVRPTHWQPLPEPPNG